MLVGPEGIMKEFGYMWHQSLCLKKQLEIPMNNEAEMWDKRGQGMTYGPL